MDAAADNSTVAGYLPEGEALRRAVDWLAAQPEPSHARIEEASQRFGLSPLEAAVLFRYFSLVTPSFNDEDQ
jgi:hypothetical protein